MGYYLLLSRSITQAQRMSRALIKAGLRAGYGRAPMTLSDRGCGYAVRVEAGKLPAALEELRRLGLMPSRIFLAREDGVYKELPLP